ncbi:MAG TPA: PAS domain S-box protein [Chloroflexota bacterium]|nr:PAS domain S-box protein [Chloroflexota bacterium]
MSDPLQPLRVLIVEDSEDDAELLLIELHKAGFRPESERVESEPEMAAALSTQEWDLILSDFNMPRFSALGALGLLQDRSLDVPFIIVSGAIGEETAVICMKAGAHDYIMKSNLARLVPVVQRELREAGERFARRLAEQALAASEQRYRTIVDTANDGIVAVDAEGCITYMNGRMREMLGYEARASTAPSPLDDTGAAAPREIEARPFADVLHQADRDDWVQRLEQLRAGARLQFDVRLVRKDGGGLWALNSCSPLLDQAGAFVGAIAMLRDVTERKQAEEALAHQALHDALTGLPNRSLLNDRLSQAILAARRENWSLGVLLIDLDRFKEVNDTFGHAYGPAAETGGATSAERLARVGYGGTAWR